MARNRIPIEIDITTRTSGSTGKLKKVEKDVKAVAKSADQAASSFKNLAGAFTSMVVADRVASGIASIVEPALNMEMSMARLSMVTGKAVNQLGDMKKMAIDVAAATSFAPQEIADAMGQLTRATGSADSAMKAMLPTATLAMASFGKMTVEQSAQMTASMVKSFSMAGDEIPLALDKVVSVARATGTKLEDFGKVMGNLGLAALRGGQSFDQMLRSFSLAKRVIESPRRAATQLIRVFGELGSKNAQEAFGRIGVSINDASGRIRNMSDIMLDLASASKLAPLEVGSALNDAFGEAAMKPMLAMLGQLTNGMTTATGEVLFGADAMNYLAGSVNNAAGSNQKIADIFGTTLSYALSNLEESMTGVLIMMGDALAPTIKVIASALSETVAVFKALGAALPGPVKWLMKTVFTGLMLGTAIWAVKTALMGMGVLLSATISWSSGLAASMTATTGSITAAGVASKAATVAVAGLKMAMGGLVIGAVAVFLPWFIKKLGELRNEASEIEKMHATNIMATDFSMGMQNKLSPAWSKKTHKERMATADLIRKTRALVGKPLSENVIKAFEDLSKFRAKTEMDINKKKMELDAARRQEDLRFAHKIKSTMVIGTKPFRDSIDKLSGLFKQKPQIIQGNALRKMENMLGQIAGARAGQVVGDVRVSQAQIDAAKKMLSDGAGTDAFRRSVLASQRQETMPSGQEFGASIGALGGTTDLLKSVFVRGSDNINKLFEKTGGAAIHSMSPEMRAAAVRQMQITRGQSLASGDASGTAIGKFIPQLGQFGDLSDPQQLAQFRTKWRSMNPFLPASMGGRSDLPGGQLSSAAMALQSGSGLRDQMYGPQLGPVDEGSFSNWYKEMPSVAFSKSEEEKRTIALQKELEELKLSLQSLTPVVKQMPDKMADAITRSTGSGQGMMGSLFGGDPAETGNAGGTY